MRDIRVAEISFYEWVEIDRESGLPVAYGKPFAEGVIPSDVEAVDIYVRFSGDPGLYRLTMRVDGHGKELDIAINFGSQLVAIPVDGDAHFIIPFPVAAPETLAGEYLFTIARDSEPLTEFGFSITD